VYARSLLHALYTDAGAHHSIHRDGSNAFVEAFKGLRGVKIFLLALNWNKTLPVCACCMQVFERVARNLVVGALDGFNGGCILEDKYV